MTTRSKRTYRSDKWRFASPHGALYAGLGSACLWCGVLSATLLFR